MAGFSSVTSDESIMFADNASFDGTERGGKMTTDGQLWIGNTAGTTSHVLLGNITSTSGTINVTYDDPNINIELAGGGVGIDTFTTDIGGNVIPNGAGEVDVTGTHVFSSGAVANRLTLDVDATQYTFLYGEGNNTAMSELGPLADGEIIIGHTGLAPTSGSIVGLSGSKESFSSNTITIKSPPYADQGVGTVTLNSGSFVTGAVTITMPASGGLSDGDLIEIIATNGVVTVQLVGTQVAHLGGDSTSAAGTLVGSATGDVLCMRYQSSTDDFWVTSAIGVWVLA